MVSLWKRREESEKPTKPLSFLLNRWSKNSRLHTVGIQHQHVSSPPQFNVYSLHQLWKSPCSLIVLGGEERVFPEKVR